MIIKYEIPIKTVSEANIRCHWAVGAKRAKHQRMVAAAFTTDAMRSNWKHMSGFKHIRITVTRMGVRKLDSDNLAISFKHGRDGVADGLCVNDGDDRLEWIYKQEKSKQYSVMVELDIQ